MMNLRLKWCLMAGCVAFSSFLGGVTAAFAGDAKRDSVPEMMSLVSYKQIFFDNPETNQPIVSSKTLLGDTAAMSIGLSDTGAGHTTIDTVIMDGIATGYYDSADCSEFPATGSTGDATTSSYTFTSGVDFNVGRESLWAMGGSRTGTHCITVFLRGAGAAEAQVRFRNLTCVGGVTNECTSTDSSACALNFSGGWSNSGMPNC